SFRGSVHAEHDEDPEVHAEPPPRRSPRRGEGRLTRLRVSAEQRGTRPNENRAHSVIINANPEAGETRLLRAPGIVRPHSAPGPRPPAHSHGGPPRTRRDTPRSRLVSIP